LSTVHGCNGLELNGPLTTRLWNASQRSGELAHSRQPSLERRLLCIGHGTVRQRCRNKEVEAVTHL